MGDQELTFIKEVLREISDDTFRSFVEECEANGDLDSDDYPTKASLIANLETFSDATLRSYAEKLKENM